MTGKFGLALCDTLPVKCHKAFGAVCAGGRASLWRLVPPTDMKAEEVDEATPKMLTRISKWQKKRMKLSTPY